MRGVAFLVHSASGTFREEEATGFVLVRLDLDTRMSCHIIKRWRDCSDVLLEWILIITFIVFHVCHVLWILQKTTLRQAIIQNKKLLAHKINVRDLNNLQPVHQQYYCDHTIARSLDGDYFAIHVWFLSQCFNRFEFGGYQEIICWINSSIFGLGVRIIFNDWNLGTTTTQIAQWETQKFIF